MHALSVADLRLVLSTWPLRRNQFTAATWRVWCSPDAVRAFLRKASWVDRALNCQLYPVNDDDLYEPFFRLTPNNVLYPTFVLKWLRADLPVGHCLIDMFTKATKELMRFGVEPTNFISRDVIWLLLSRRFIQEQSHWPLGHPFRDFGFGAMNGNLKLGKYNANNMSIDTLREFAKSGTHLKIERLPQGHPLRYLPFGCHMGCVKMGPNVDNCINHTFVGFLLSDVFFEMQARLQIGDPLRFENHVFEQGHLKLGNGRHNWLTLGTMVMLCVLGKERHLLPREHPLHALRFGAYMGSIKTQPNVSFHTDRYGRWIVGNIIADEYEVGKPGLNFLLSKEYREGIQRLHPDHLIRTLKFGTDSSACIFLSQETPLLYNCISAERTAAFLMSEVCIDAQAKLCDDDQFKCTPLNGDWKGNIMLSYRGIPCGASVEMYKFFLLSADWRNYRANLAPTHQLACGKLLDIQMRNLGLEPRSMMNYVTLSTLKAVTSSSTVRFQEKLPVGHYLRLENVQGYWGHIFTGPNPCNWLAEKTLKLLVSQRWLSTQAALPTSHPFHVTKMHLGCNSGGIKTGEDDDDWLHPDFLDYMADGRFQQALLKISSDEKHFMREIFMHGSFKGAPRIAPRTANRITEAVDWIDFPTFVLFMDVNDDSTTTLTNLREWTDPIM
jgi:hypothetical protein